jgi:hydroxyacylglutathione hydrolase
MLIKIFSCGPIETNTVLFACEVTKKAAIVDAPLESLEVLKAAVQKNSLHPEMLLLTHSHWDHIADAGLIKEKFGIPIYVHPEDAGNLETPGADGLPLFFPIKGVKPDHFLKDGQVLHVGSIEVRVIATPGHSPGCVSFWLPQEKVLISGDTLFQGTMGRLDLSTGRPELMGESLKKLSELPPETKVIPGHGGETTIQAEKWIKKRFL